MSKGEGLKIGIKFTEDIVGDVVLQGTLEEKQDGEWTANGTYSTFTVDRAKDGDTSSYWQSRSSSNYIQIARPNTRLLGIKIYKGGSYKPTNFTLSISEDGNTYTDVESGNLVDAAGWETVMFNTHAESNYFRINFGYGSRLYLYELVLLVDESEFTVTGQEYKYVNGPLIDVNYQVKKVERYPIQRVWALEEELKLESQIIGYTDDLTPKMTSNNAPSGEVTFSRQNNNDGNAAFRVFDKDNETRWSTGSSPSYPYGWVAYEFPSQQNICKYTIRAHPTNGSSAPRNWVFEGWDGANYVILDEQNDINFSDGEYKEFTFNNNNHYIKYRLNVSLNGGAAFLGIAEIELIGGIYEFTTPQNYTSQAIQLDGDYRLRWIENKPENTDILIKYTTGETQGQWQEVDNGEVINIDTNLWIGATLSTEDEAITPILQDLWLEDLDAPQDTILLTMDPLRRFNNVEGDLTVRYDASKGSLSGRAGVVGSFTETFTPTDLEPKPNPHVAENIEVSAEANVTFIKVTHNLAYEEEHLTVSTSATVDFIYVGIINP